MTNLWILTAGLCSAGLTAVHVSLGGADVYVPLLKTTTDPVLKGFVSVIWHAVTGFLALTSVLLIVASRVPPLRNLLSVIVLAQHALFVALFVGYSLYWTADPFALPPWIGFVGVIMLTVVGLRRPARSEVTP